MDHLLFTFSDSSESVNGSGGTAPYAGYSHQLTAGVHSTTGADIPPPVTVAGGPPGVPGQPLTLAHHAQDPAINHIKPESSDIPHSH